MGPWQKRLSGRLRGKVTTIDRTEVPEGVCELCGGKDEELRPYGRNSEWICYDCAMKDQNTTNARIANVLFGDALPDHLPPPIDKPDPKE